MTRTRAHHRILRRLARRRTRALSSIVVHLDADTTAYDTSMAKLRRAMAVLDLRRREARSIIGYHNRIRWERDIGLAYVHAKAARVRAELGLEDR